MEHDYLKKKNKTKKQKKQKKTTKKKNSQSHFNSRINVKFGGNWLSGF